MLEGLGPGQLEGLRPGQREGPGWVFTALTL